jgi:hypothetical protein
MGEDGKLEQNHNSVRIKRNHANAAIERAKTVRQQSALIRQAVIQTHKMAAEVVAKSLELRKMMGLR